MSNTGFTLLELMIVITIVAIFSGIGIPSFTVLIANQRTHAAASDLQSALWRTRSEAIRLNRDVTLAPAIAADGWESGWVAVNPAFTGEQLIQREALAGVTLSGGPASVTYRASGRLRGQAAVALFEVASKTSVDANVYCVRIDPCGRPMMSPDGC